MIATHFFQQVNQWFVPFVRHSQTTAECAAPAQPATSEQVIVQPGDSYFFDVLNEKQRFVSRKSLGKLHFSLQAQFSTK
jgi:hypothetical protein